MAGNTWEMVADWNGDYLPEKRVNPTGSLTGSRRLARGGHGTPARIMRAVRCEPTLAWTGNSIMPVSAARNLPPKFRYLDYSQNRPHLE